MILFNPSTQSQQYKERDSQYDPSCTLISWNVASTHFIVISYCCGSPLEYTTVIILKCCEDYSNSTFRNPIMVLPSFIVDIILLVAKQKLAITY